jgi:hypothetical protein
MCYHKYGVQVMCEVNFYCTILCTDPFTLTESQFKDLVPLSHWKDLDDALPQVWCASDVRGAFLLHRLALLTRSHSQTEFPKDRGKPVCGGAVVTPKNNTEWVFSSAETYPLTAQTEPAGFVAADMRVGVRILRLR